MGNPVELNDVQRKLRDTLEELDCKIWSFYKDTSKSQNYIEMQPIYEEMKKTAHELHMSLKASGHEPKHHKYMLKNRGVPADDIEFYNHIHPVDDLLAFIEDENANDDPEDTTIGKEFTLKIYSRRWGHFDYYYMIRTKSGWTFKSLISPEAAKCNKKGFPKLYEALDHDTICYPKQIDDFFEYLWNQASEGLSEDEVQECFDMIGEWISSCEMNTPKGIFGDLI